MPVRPLAVDTSRSLNTGGRASRTTYFGRRTMPFRGLSTSRASGCSSSGFGAGFGAGGTYFGVAAASCAATSPELTRCRFGADAGAVGDETADVAGGGAAGDCARPALSPASASKTTSEAESGRTMEVLKPGTTRSSVQSPVETGAVGIL